MTDGAKVERKAAVVWLRNMARVRQDISDCAQTKEVADFNRGVMRGYLNAMAGIERGEHLDDKP